MMRRTERTWSQLKVGIVILLAIAGILVAIMNLNEGMGLFTHRTTFRAQLSDSLGIKVGAPVRMNGVDIGNIKYVGINTGNGQVEIRFTVTNEVRLLLHQDATVLIRPMGLLGDKYLEVLPGSREQPSLPNGAVLSGRGESDITSVAGNATATLQNVDHTLRELHVVLADINEGRGTAGKLVKDPALYNQAAQLIRKVDALSDRTSELLAKVERGEGTLGKLVTDREFYERATTAVAEMQKLAALLNQPDGSLGKLARDPALYQRLEGVTAKSEALVGRIERGDGTLGKLVTQDQLYQRADKVLTEMENLLADVKKNPTKYFKFSVF